MQREALSERQRTSRRHSVRFHVRICSVSKCDALELDINYGLQLRALERNDGMIHGGLEEGVARGRPGTVMDVVQLRCLAVIKEFVFVIKFLEDVFNIPTKVDEF